MLEADRFYNDPGANDVCDGSVDYYECDWDPPVIRIEVQQIDVITSEKTSDFCACQKQTSETKPLEKPDGEGDESAPLWAATPTRLREMRQCDCEQTQPGAFTDLSQQQPMPSMAEQAPVLQNSFTSALRLQIEKTEIVRSAIPQPKNERNVEKPKEELPVCECGEEETIRQDVPEMEEPVAVNDAAPVSTPCPCAAQNPNSDAPLPMVGRFVASNAPKQMDQTPYEILAES